MPGRCLVLAIPGYAGDFVLQQLEQKPYPERLQHGAIEDVGEYLLQNDDSV
jgi:hypothetical protein